MATFRVGVGSFNIKDGAVGFGTDTDGLGNLKVKGVTKTTDIKVSGASTLTRYAGFAADNINQLENITLTSEVGTIGDIVVGVGTSVIISSASTVTVGTVESVSIGTHFSPPVGGVEERGKDFVEGMMRFNTDLNTMEFYNGSEWRQFTYISDIQNSPSSRGRGIYVGGLTPSTISTISFFSLISGGSVQDFGSLLDITAGCTGTASDGTRGIIAGGFTPSDIDKIQYITMQSQSDSIDFGDLTDARYAIGSVSSSTRGVFGGGWTPNNTNVIDYVEIQTLGDALDFGDLSEGGNHGNPGCQSPVRGIFGGGYASVSPDTDGPYTGKRLQIINMASKGNATKFGELGQGRARPAGGGNSIRGIWAGGYGVVDNTTSYTGYLDSIEYITISSEGNATNFGELTEVAGSGTSGTSSQIRFCRAGGFETPSPSVISKNIDTVIIATTGNAVNFAELDVARSRHGGLSDCHGGLGGY